MRATKALGLLLAAAMVTLSLSGCIPGVGTQARTESLADELRGMPGVSMVGIDFREASLSNPPRSSVDVRMGGATTQREALDVLAKFAAANLAAGVGIVSTRLSIEIESPQRVYFDSLMFDFPNAGAEQLEELTQAWFDLRERYGAAGETGVAFWNDLENPDLPRYEVTITVPEGSAPAVELDAIRGVRAVFADLGDVNPLTVENGAFRSRGGLPTEATLAMVESMLAVERVQGAGGDFRGPESVYLKVALTAQPWPADDAVGAPAVMVELVDLIRKADIQAELDFTLTTGMETGWFFDNESCLRYVNLPKTVEGNESKELLLHWGADGRTVLDGQTVATCFR